MSGLLTPTKTERGWVVQMLPEMAADAGVADGSIVVLHFQPSGVTAEILPPATAEMKQEVREIADKFQDLFAELKRRGD